MKHYVYILYSQLRDRYYIGSAADIEKRLLRHNAGATPSTKPGRPWKIVYAQAFDSKTEALLFDKPLKYNKRSQPIESLIFNNGFRG